VYDGIEANLEKKYGLPSGGMRAIRTKGERSNADQVSSAAAQSVYQIIPETRAAFKKKYGVDAYASKEAAAEVAALHLRDSMRRGNNWSGAVSEYIGGTDRRNHGAQTRAYTSRVTGKAPVGGAPAPSGPPGIRLEDISTGDLLNMTVDDLGGDHRRPLGPQAPDPSQRPSAKRAAHVAAITGGKGVAVSAPVDNTPDVADVLERQDTALAATARNAEIGFTDRVGASLGDWLGASMITALTEANPEAEAGYADFYMKHWDAIEENATSQREVDELRETTSRADQFIVLQRQASERERNKVLDSNGTGTAFRIVAGLLDPVGWVAGGAVSKALQLAGAAGKAAIIARSMAEGAIGNIAITASLDASGKYTTAEDYAVSGLFGLGIGAMISPLAVVGSRAARADNTAVAEIARMREAQAQSEAARLVQAQTNVGEGAAPERLGAEIQRLQTVEQREWIEQSLADVPDQLRLLSENPDRLLTADPAVLKDVTARANLEAISDDAERGMIAEHLARSEAILRVNPINQQALKTSLALVGMESTGIRLLASESPVARATSLMLLEGTTGAGGRRRTAAMAQAVRERVYNRHMIEYDGLATQFRKGEGGSVFKDAWDGSYRRRFNERVYDEVEARGHGGSVELNQAVIRAADAWERGMNAMRIEQQHIGTIGSARLGMTSLGYMTHKLDSAKVLRLTPSQQRVVRSKLSAQFEHTDNGFDKKFSDQLAVKYLEKARERAKGGYDVPMNLHSPEAADIVRDSLEAMNLGADEVEKLMGKYSRGGASHTKRRLRLDLSEDIGDGMKLRDLFNTDISSMYRGYARRVSGEVALAQYGIMGKKGLNVLRKAVQETGGTANDLKAFDQIAAEFLNTPFGDWNHKYMDNLRIATSAARLGGMGFTQLAEYGNGLAAVGVMRTFAAISALPRLRAEVSQLAKGGKAENSILQSIDHLGGHIGLDDYNLTRMFDVKDNDVQLYNSEHIGVMTRALRAGANLQAMVSGHRMITAVQTRGMAEQIVRKAVQYARTGADDAHLNDMGINEELRAVLRKDMDQIATFEGGTLRELDLSKSSMTGDQLMTFRDAIERGASQIIQRTYTGETGKWAHNGFLKMLLQFRTFSLISVEKQWGRGVALRGGGGMAALKTSAYLFGSMGFALPIHMARVQLKMVGMSPADRRKYAEQNLSEGALGRATLNYASASGLLGDILDVGSGFASSFGGDGGEEWAGYVGARGGGRGQIIGGVVAPGVGLIQDLYKGIGADGGGGNAKKLFKAMPGSNLPGATQLITGLTSD
jgi:hypothetical protein